MRIVAMLSVAWIIAGGCAWTPERDNPVDPGSPFYVEPPQANRAPQVEQVRATTHIQISNTDFYTTEITALISDPDNNLRFDSVSAVIGSQALGRMSFDGERGLFTLQFSGNDFPGVNWRDYFDLDTIRVTAIDDSLAMASGWAVYNCPEVLPPILRYPIVEEDWVSLRPVLNWHSWGTPSDGHAYSVRVFLYEQLMWDTTGLSAELDSVKVTRTLPSSSEDSSRKYTWYLTVLDARGDTRTSRPGLFRCAAQPDTLIAHRDSDRNR